jgi:hypothetical protein
MAPFGMVNADSGKGIEYDALENMASFALLCALQKSKVDSPSLSNYTSVGRRIIQEEPRPRLLLAFFLLAHDAPEHGVTHLIHHFNHYIIYTDYAYGYIFAYSLYYIVFF